MKKDPCAELALAVMMQIRDDYREAWRYSAGRLRNYPIWMHQDGYTEREKLRDLVEDSAIMRFWADASGFGDLSRRKLIERLNEEDTKWREIIQP